MNLFKKVMIIACFTFLVAHCTIIKMGTLFLGGKLEEKNFSEKVDFRYRGRLIFVNVKINQSPKIFKFIIDTGAALSVVSRDIASEVGIKALVRDQISDATKKKETIDFGKIAHLTIGNITFKNIGTAIFDVNKTTRLACYGIDGVIGANLLRLVKIWRINYRDRSIIFTDKSDFIKTGSLTKIIPFKKNRQKIPEIEIDLGIQDKIKCKLDLGSTRGFISSLPEFRKVKQKYKKLVFIKGYGEASEGALGVKVNYLYLAKLKNIKAGNSTIRPVLMEFCDNVYTSVGNGFFENYILTINWGKSELYLKPYIENNKEPGLATYGFNYNFNKAKNQLYISFLYENSPASKAGLQIGDQIIGINDFNLEDISDSQYCRFFFNPDLLFKTEPIKMVIKRGEQKKETTLHKAVLIDYH